MLRISENPFGNEHIAKLLHALIPREIKGSRDICPYGEYVRIMLDIFVEGHYSGWKGQRQIIFKLQIFHHYIQRKNNNNDGCRNFFIRVRSNVDRISWIPQLNSFFFLLILLFATNCSLSGLPFSSIY